MVRFLRVLGVLLVLGAVLAPGMVWARAGGGASMGSRGGFTYSPPPVTNTAPYGATPFNRSLTPQPAPGYPSYGAPSYGTPGYGGRSPFVSGLMGGLIGAGLGGLLLGHGFFGGFTGFGSFIGFLLQIALIVWVVRLLLRSFGARAQPAGGAPGMFARGFPGAFARPNVGGGGGGGAPPVGALRVEQQDFQAFEQILQNVQAAWSAHDIARLQQLATPEMVSYFAEQLSDQASRGVRNVVSDVRLEQGDLSQAWSEHGREYATVAMRFSMNDVTRDRAGHVVEGDAALRSMATEIWTFVRAPGGRWLLSAIQQTR